MLSSVFVPLYGVILARLGGRADVTALIGQRKVDVGAVAIWFAGIACYHALAQWTPQWGSALPTLVLTFVLARLSRGFAPSPSGRGV
jgi:hypothetical protein